MACTLVIPTMDHLPSYRAALLRGWSSDTMRPAAAQEELARIAEDAETFIALMDDKEARGGAVTLPDGSTVPRLPGFRRWIWDGAFCGSVGFRWQKGTSKLPPYVLGHIGYSVVPWKQRRGYATHALALLLAEIRPLGLDYVELSTDEDNHPSQRVILANNGVFVERFARTEAYGGANALRYRIWLRK